jgi:predicted ArsR family transcriptional regulator
MTDSAYGAAIGKRQREIKEKFLEVLREMPIIEIACKKSGIGRTTYYRWRRTDHAFASMSDDAWRQGIDFINDMSESQMIHMIKEKKIAAISMWLKHNSSRYRVTPRTPTLPTQESPAFQLYKLVKELDNAGKEHERES